MRRQVTRGTMLIRGMRRRCPNCGTKAFTTWFTMVDVCSGCGLHFERESGYWVGAVTINTALTFASFLVLFVGLTLLTWPDPPWGVIMASVIGVNLVFPIMFYPISKSLWAAIEQTWRPLEAKDFPTEIR